MSLAEITLLVFLVTDPFGNLPMILTVLRQAEDRQYRRIVLRETILAFLVLLLFAAGGTRILGALNVAQPVLSVAGGVILFLISLKMIFGRTDEIFDERSRDDPFLVPIAVPAIAGPAALTTVIVLTTQRGVALGEAALALGIVFLLMLATLLPGRWLADRLGNRGLNALERFMGLLLNLVAVNMIMVGAKAFFAVA
jgi:multiple antibiotic resistance protein